MASQLNETLDALKKIKELLNDSSLQTSARDANERTNVLELSLEELRIIYARLDASMHTTRLRILTFLGAGLALLSYLYSGGDLFIPPERYGRVFYFLGLGLLTAGLCFLLQAIRPNQWSVPLEANLIKLNRLKTKLGFLEEVVEQYVESMVMNIGG